MALTFKKFAVGFIKLPGMILSGLSALAFGYTEKNEQGETKKRHGLFSLLLTGLIAIGRGLTNIIAKHITAVSTAFWLSLIVGGALALTVFLLPAALTAITSFSVFGFTLGGLIGGFSIGAQSAVIGGLAALATSVVTYACTAIVNGISALINKCCSSHTKSELDTKTSSDEKHGAKHTRTSASTLKGLGGSAPAQDRTEHQAPTTHSSLLLDASEVARRQQLQADEAAIQQQQQPAQAALIV